ncbi:Hypp1503 [Branchiostoma lanceolatum]|uniref:Hypp1503 protein n=1 Tax=Branchiostoma lanceolatum TaxID=7740 RepID=A0A8J9ZIE7_BRALA|nr:Hypp1503 [Branchiostoma lanceolatum]
MQGCGRKSSSLTVHDLYFTTWENWAQTASELCLSEDGVTTTTSKTMRANMVVAALVLLSLVVTEHTSVVHGRRTTLCHNDYQCISGMGRGACCAPRNLIFAPVPECKPAGRRAQLCHVASNFLPYPLHQPHGFHRCPCGSGLACVPRRRGSVIGVCRDLKDL